MSDELLNYIFHKEAESIIEKCKEINKPIEKEKRDKEALSYIRERVGTLLNYVEDDIFVFKEDSFDDMSDEEFSETFRYVEQSLKDLTKALVLGNKKDKYYNSYFNQFCLCLYDRCKLEFTRFYRGQGHKYRISDLLLMSSNTIKNN